MPKLNTPIVLSIMTDIKELVSVSNELYSWIGDIEHQSWKFPTKSGRNINVLEILELHKGSAGEMYILLLELAYDRINFVLRLIIEFMDIYPSVEDFPKEMKNVKRPQYMSIAAAMRLLWDRLKRLPDTISKRMAKMKGVQLMDEESFAEAEKISRSTQADGVGVGVGGCFKHCRSCSLAASTILDLIKGIEATFLEYKMHSAAAEQRELSKFSLWDKSQWAVMSKLTEAINQDVSIILELVRDSTRISESVKRLQVDIDMLKAKNAQFTQLIRSLRAQLETVRTDKLQMAQRNEDLTTALQETRKQICQLAVCNREIKNQLQEVSCTKIALQKRLDTLETDLDLAQEKSIEKDKLQSSIKTEFECKIEKLEAELLATKSLAKMRNNQNCRCTASVEKLTKTNSNSAVKPGDNPEADMTQQFNWNQEKIKQLMRQNERLSKTLERLREHRLAGVGEHGTYC